jgi:putative RecB family exonuclease
MPKRGSPIPGTAPTPRNLFSFSRVKTFHQCPLRYRYRYLKGMREAFRSIESYLGNVVHEVLEWLYEERHNTGSPNIDAALDRFAHQWQYSSNDNVAVVRTDDDPDGYFRIGREMLERFHRGTFQRDRSETLALEQRFSLRLSPEIAFTGIADRVGRTEKGLLFVVDYKTSKSEGDSSEFSEGLQAPLYAACALGHHDETEALAGYHYLRHGTTRWHRISRAMGESLKDRFLSLAEGVIAAAEFPARPGILCAWCGFNAVCPSAEVPVDLSGGQRIAERILIGDSPPENG